jgi:hypothetical protein
MPHPVAGAALSAAPPSPARCRSMFKKFSPMTHGGTPPTVHRAI